MESLKGIPLKLIGLERFLQRCPEWAGKIVLVQVGISAFERGDDYTKTRNEVMSMVTNINNRWPGTVQFQECAESEMRLQQRMALLRAADVVMVTTIRDGLNLIPLVSSVHVAKFVVSWHGFTILMLSRLLSIRFTFRNLRLLTLMPSPRRGETMDAKGDCAYCLSSLVVLVSCAVPSM